MINSSLVLQDSLKQVPDEAENKGIRKLLPNHPDSTAARRPSEISSTLAAFAPLTAA